MRSLISPSISASPIGSPTAEAQRGTRISLRASRRDALPTALRARAVDAFVSFFLPPIPLFFKTTHFGERRLTVRCPTNLETKDSCAAHSGFGLQQRPYSPASE